MALISNTRKNLLQIVNAVRAKLGLPSVNNLTSDVQASTLLNYLNDVISIVSDYGDWQEAYFETTVTASTSVIEYLVNVSGKVIKNIHEVAFQGQIAPLRPETLDNIRRWGRTSGTGQPRNWCIVGVDNVTTGSPYIRVYPMPGIQQNNQIFNLACYEKPALYTTADVSAVPIFDADLLEQGLLAMALLDESRGTQNIDFITQFLKIFEPRMNEAYNRYNGDSGSDIVFRPIMQGYRR